MDFSDINVGHRYLILLNEFDLTRDKGGSVKRFSK